MTCEVHLIVLSNLRQKKKFLQCKALFTILQKQKKSIDIKLSDKMLKSDRKQYYCKSLLRTLRTIKSYNFQLMLT